MGENKKKPHPAEGHRGRLRERFIQSGLDAFLDYEIIELLLTLGTPRKDCKQMAKELIKKFGGLREVLDASQQELSKTEGIGLMNSFGLKLFQSMAERYEREKIVQKIVLETPQKVAKYLQEKIGREEKEHFITLCLDTKNNLIKIIEISIGTLNESLVHPREIFKEAVVNHAAQVIVSHNHPSGDIQPSSQDLLVTKRLVEVGKILGIELLDHIIVSRSNFLSFREQNLI
ncbi:MAG: DNA repair protein RadC [Candidatus Doudnabacteria bacterium]|nr:DNA repair protein RadC [Candidatus Doudnabacteria bacterium]